MRFMAALRLRDWLTDDCAGVRGWVLPTGAARVTASLSAPALPFAIIACDSSASRSGPGSPLP